MATLRFLADNQLRPVSARMLIGRSASAALQLDDTRVSGEHAVLQWRKGRWELRDLASRNGTFLAGKRLDAGEVCEVPAGTQFAFGHPENLWELVEAGPPSALGVPVDGGEAVVASGGILALPSADNPEVTVYADARGHWMYESDGEAQRASDGLIVVAGDSNWRISLPSQIEGTATVDIGPTLDTVKLRFAVSRDEEYVQITVIHRGKEIPLESREHAYVLLTLARLRIEEAHEPIGEQGWTDRDRLLKMLGMDSNSLNVAIYRARGQLSSAGIDGAAAVVEVRRGQRRLGVEPSMMTVVPL